MQRPYLSPSLQHNPYVNPPGGYEDDHMRVIANDLAARLRLNGTFNVRLSDPLWDALPQGTYLAKVCQASNDFNATFHLALHSDAGPSGAVGTASFNHDGSAEGHRLATILQKYVGPVSPGKDRGVKAGDFYELNHTSSPAVLIELAFHTNTADALSLVQHKVDYATALYFGICEWADVSRHGGRAATLKVTARELAVLNGIAVPDALVATSDVLGAAADTLLYRLVEKV